MEPLKLQTIADVKAALERAIDLVLADPCADSVSRARVIIQASTSAGRVIEAAEIERRLAELEKQLNENREQER